ncbi:uroplakin-1a [Rhinoraja longicauda]
MVVFLFLLCGIALTAECIFHVSDQHNLWPILAAADNTDVFAAAWIGVFVGFCLFLLSIVGIFGIMKSAKKVILTYLILMLIVYIFEAASCITAATQRDFNNCCGVNGPQDWIEFNSAFRSMHTDSEFPWPRQCCSTDQFGQMLNVTGCKLGIPGYIYNQFFVLVGTMYYYAILQN